MTVIKNKYPKPKEFLSLFVPITLLIKNTKQRRIVPIISGSLCVIQSRNKPYEYEIYDFYLTDYDSYISIICQCKSLLKGHISNL